MPPKKVLQFPVRKIPDSWYTFKDERMAHAEKRRKRLLAVVVAAAFVAAVAIGVAGGYALSMVLG
jgi:type IV secretory pathway component VirB8